MKKICKNFFKAVLKYKKESTLSLVLILILSVLSVAIPALIKVFLDWITSNQFQLTYLVIGITGFGLLLFIKTLFNTLWYLSLDNFGERYITNLTLECQNALDKAYLSDIDGISSNTIKHTLYYDILEAFRVIAHHIPTIIGSVIVITLSFILSFHFNSFISLLILFSLFLGISISFFSRNVIAKKASSTNSKLKELHNTVSEFTEGIPSIQTNLTIGYYNNKIRNSISSFVSTAKKEDKVIYFWSGVIQNYSILFSIILSAILAYSLDENALVNFAFFSVLSSIIMSEGQKIEFMLHQTIKSKVCFNNIDRVASISQRTGYNKLFDINTIDFEEVSFSYLKESKDIISGLNLSLNKGDCVRVIGPNGSGKSSIIKVLTRLYPIKGGVIKINGISINDIDSKSLFSNILYVNQDEFLMNDSIINYLKENTYKQDEDILTEQLKDFNLVDKELINNGSNLSLGQRKKVFFIKARFNIEKAKLIIFDEITSGMDKNTQIEFANFVNRYASTKDKIIIVVDHNNIGGILFNKNIDL